MHIGLLEDDIAIQEMLRLVLQDEGYTVTIYPTAEACLKVFNVDEQQELIAPADLLIVDLRLSRAILGTEVIRRIRDNPRLHTLPIILTTAATFTDIEDLEHLHVTLLQKPFDVDEVVAIIKDLTQPQLPMKC